MGNAKYFGIFFGLSYSIAVGQLPWNTFSGSCKQIGIVAKADYSAIPWCVSTYSAPSGVWLDYWSGSFSSGSWYAFSYGTIARVASDSANNPWVTMDDGSIWQWTGSSWAGHSINTWGAREIGIAGSGSPSVWAISDAQFSGTSDYWVARRESNGSWSWIYGAGIEIAVDMSTGVAPASPRAWVVNSAGNVYEWIQTLNGGQGGWNHHPYVKAAGSGLDIPGLGAIDIAAGYLNIVYVIGNDIDGDGNGSVWRLTNPGSPQRSWDYMYARGKKIAVSNANSVFVTKADNSIIHLHAQ